MSQLQKRMRHITNSVAAISLPLRKIGTHFTHDITFGRGEISILTDRQDFFDFYYKNSFPIICANDEGRILNSGVYITQTLKKDYADHYSKIFDVVSRQFSFNHALHIVKREADCQHLYSFNFDLEENDFLQTVLNKIDYFKNFIAYYKARASQLIHQASQKKNRLILPCSNQSNTDNFSKENNLIEKAKKQSFVIHASTKKRIYLTPQQNKCLGLLVKGHSAKEMARELHLSPRTIENYILKTRNMLGCATSKEFIADYHSQFSSVE